LAALVDDVEVLYRDVPVDAWFAPYVSSLIEEEIATGYENEQGEPIGEFGVSNPVTYAEVLKMSLEAVGVSLQSGTSRNISAQGTWADAYVAYGESEGISVLTPSLNVHESSTRGAVIQIMLEAMGILIGPKSETSYTDVSPNHPYARAIATATFIELIEGDSDTSGNKLNTFRPDEPINRAEVAKIVAIAKELLH
ncbi:S-layer homology domain-containing protein, partial [Patescibacteria group bacterium]|nr:S-layer homology domain-containing protein [Patescibacteria group bacterium]